MVGPQKDLTRRQRPQIIHSKRKSPQSKDLPIILLLPFFDLPLPYYVNLGSGWYSNLLRAEQIKRYPSSGTDFFFYSCSLPCLVKLAHHFSALHFV